MQVRNGAAVARVLAIVIMLAGVRSAYGDTGEIVKIADQSTAIPGGTADFASFSQPQVSLGNILFYGRDANGNGGLYRFDPTTRGLTFAMTGSQNFGLYGQDISYVVFTSSGNALYTTRGGLHMVADGVSMPTPTFGPTGPISMDDRLIVFTKTYDPGYPKPIVAGFGTVDAYGTIKTFAPSVSVNRRLARGGNVAYSSQLMAMGAARGGYYISSSAGTFQFDNPYTGPSNFTLPGDDPSTTTVGGTSPSFGDDGNAVVFSAWSRPISGAPDQLIQRGLYTKPAGGQLRTVANNFTVVPGSDGTTTFYSFDSPTIDGANIAFIGGPATGPQGIFAESGGVLRQIVSVGDTLDGRTVKSLSFSDDRPLSGNDLVFTATFTDGSTGLFLAEVPEPAAISLVTMAGVATLASRRRRA